MTVKGTGRRRDLAWSRQVRDSQPGMRKLNDPAEVEEPYRDASKLDARVRLYELYHVPERGRALSEIRRVLAPGGRFYVATNGWTHLQELRELVFGGLEQHIRRQIELLGSLHIGVSAGLFEAV